MKARVLVRNSGTGQITSVAASAVPMLAPAGWQPLTDDERAAYEQEQAQARAARNEALRPASARRAEAAAQAAAASEASVAQVPPAVEEPEQKRSGARRRTESTDHEQES